MLLFQWPDRPSDPAIGEGCEVRRGETRPVDRDDCAGHWLEGRAKVNRGLDNQDAPLVGIDPDGAKQRRFKHLKTSFADNDLDNRPPGGTDLKDSRPAQPGLRAGSHW